MWKQFGKDYFNFTAKERRGVIIIVVLIIIFIFIPFLFPLFLKQEAFSHSEFEHEIARLTIKKKILQKTILSILMLNPIKIIFQAGIEDPKLKKRSCFILTQILLPLRIGKN